MKEPRQREALRASPALKKEIQSYCRDNRLTPRETDIVVVLAEGVVRIKDIAERLKLSPNTINNHVNSIFLKTKTRSKTELLTILLNRISDDLRWARLMGRRPRVLCLCDKGQSEIVSGLEKFQFHSRVVTAEFARAIAEFNPHFVIDERSSSEDIKKRVLEMREKCPSRVLFVHDLVDEDIRTEAMEAGAVDCFARNVRSEELALIMLLHFIEEDGTLASFLEDRLSSRMIASRAPLRLAPENWGSGGVFLNKDDLGTMFERTLAPGDWVEFPVEIKANEPHIIIRGNVAWLRTDVRQGRGPGAAIRVAGGIPEKVKGSPAYIPAGPLVS